MRFSGVCAFLCASALLAGCADTAAKSRDSVFASISERAPAGFVATGEELRSRTVREPPEDMGRRAALAAFCAAAGEARERGWSTLYVSIREPEFGADRANAEGDIRNLRAIVVLDVARDEGRLPGARGFSVEAAFAEGGDCR
jgi:hypothetical protein